ncbi:hypothetical protein ACDX78_18885 [Virgibacillus oceani]
MKNTKVQVRANVIIRTSAKGLLENYKNPDPLDEVKSAWLKVVEENHEGYRLKPRLNECNNTPYYL